LPNVMDSASSATGMIEEQATVPKHEPWLLLLILLSNDKSTLPHVLALRGHL